MAMEQQFKYGNKPQDEPGAGGPMALSQGPQGGPSGAPSGPMAASGRPQAGPQGTGQAFNIQRYLQANPNAGANIAQKAEAHITGQLGSQKEKAETTGRSMAEAIQQGKTGFGEGGRFSQIQSALGSAQQDIKSFDPNAFMQGEQGQQFSQMLGRGPEGQDAFDESAALRAQETALAAQQQGLQSAQQRFDQLGSEEGRFGLLRELVGTNAAQFAPRYTTGQSRLGQLFMQTQAAPQLQQLQSSLQSEYIDPLKSAATSSEAARQEILGLADQEAKAKEALLGQAQGLYGAYGEAIKGDLAGRQKAAEDLRQSQQKYLETTQSILGGGQALNESNIQDFLEGLKLTQLGAGTRLYGNQLQGNALGEVSRELYDPSQFIKEDEAKRFGGLAQMAGLQENVPGIGKYAEQGPKIFTPGDLTKATEAGISNTLGGINQLPIDPIFANKDTIASEIRAGKTSQDILAPTLREANISEAEFNAKRLNNPEVFARYSSWVGLKSPYMRYKEDAANNAAMIQNQLNAANFDETLRSRVEQQANRAAQTAATEQERRSILNAIAQFGKWQGFSPEAGTVMAQPIK